MIGPVRSLKDMEFVFELVSGFSGVENEQIVECIMGFLDSDNGDGMALPLKIEGEAVRGWMVPGSFSGLSSLRGGSSDLLGDGITGICRGSQVGGLEVTPEKGSDGRWRCLGVGELDDGAIDSEEGEEGGNLDGADLLLGAVDPIPVMLRPIGIESVLPGRLHAELYPGQGGDFHHPAIGDAAVRMDSGLEVRVVRLQRREEGTQHHLQASVPAAPFVRLLHVDYVTHVSAPA